MALSPEKYRNVWVAFVDYLRELGIVRIKRLCLRLTSIDMHNFFDSPKHIYPDVVYLRIKTNVGVSVRFICEYEGYPAEISFYLAFRIAETCLVK